MQIHVLEVKFGFNGKDDALYPVILRKGKEMILVDCGYAGFMPLLEQAASLQGLSLQHLTGILVTHHDIDHMGALAEFKEKYPQVVIYSSAIEEKYISGKAKSLRLQQAEDMFHTLPEEQKAGAQYFQEMLRKMQPVPVDYILPENESALFLEEVKIIPTPGHMPGHISLYVEESQTVIAADAVVYENGELEIANPHFTLDLPAAVRSVEKLQQLAIHKLICYHGGVVEDGIQQKLQTLIGKYASFSSIQ
jgi:glyoxylase-like metal-dependent hydrolase (beta-lactamase superfamily II)